MVLREGVCVCVACECVGIIKEIKNKTFSNEKGCILQE